MPSLKNASPISPNSPSVPKSLFWAARPKTWIAGLSPVWVGTACVEGPIRWDVFLLTMCFSLFIQIGTNYANDYFDYVLGADSVLRNGPKRATQEGWISPRAMLRSALIVFAAAFIAGIPLMRIAGFWSVPLALLCIVCGILYTGGPKPLGYIGLGELFVLVFFGPVAVCGSYFLQTGVVNDFVFFASLPPGLLSSAILIANNLRDEKSDRAANKRTLVVRFGRRFGAWEYAFMIVSAALISLALGRTAASLILPASVPLLRKAFGFRDPLELISLLQNTALLLVLYTVLFCFGMVW